jgi:hypothetical protein
MRNASNDLTFDSVEPPVDTSTPRFFYSAQKAILTVSMEIQKDAIFDRLKIKEINLKCCTCNMFNNRN